MIDNNVYSTLLLTDVLKIANNVFTFPSTDILIIDNNVQFTFLLTYIPMIDNNVHAVHLSIDRYSDD